MARRRRAILVIIGLLLLLASAVAFAPRLWLGRFIPPDTAGASFNLSLLAEVRVSLALLGGLCLVVALLPRQLAAAADRLAGPLARFDRWLRTGRRWSLTILVAAGLAAAILAGYSIARHNAFNSKAYDLGLHAQVWWNTSHGRLFASSVEVDNYLGDHVSPIILLLAPLYRLWPDPRTLLLVQALALAAGAVPLALLARRRLPTAWPDGAHVAALLLALIYLSYPALGFVNRFEFHEEVLAVPLLLTAFWALETRRLGVMSLALALTLLCKEDLGLTVAAFGIFIWWRGRRENRTRTNADGRGPERTEPTPTLVTLSGSGAQPPPAREASEVSRAPYEPTPTLVTLSGSATQPPPAREASEESQPRKTDRRLQTLGLLWAGVGLAWSLVALFVVIPAFRGAPSDTLARYGWLGGGPTNPLALVAQHPTRLLRHILGEPRRLWMLVKFLLPVGFLPLLSPALLVALPSLAINWLAGNLYQSSIYFHYAAALIPVVFAAAVYGLERTVPSHASRFTHHVSLQVPRNSQSSFTLALLWLIACAALALAFDLFWQPTTGPADWENYGMQRYVDTASFQKAAKLLPADAAVATTEAYAPHLANRQGLYLLHDPRILEVADRVDWVLVDLNDHRYGVQPRLYYALLGWIAERRGLDVCHFAGDVVLLGPGCGDAKAAEAYTARLAKLQRATAGQQVDPALIELIGERYFAK